MFIRSYRIHCLFSFFLLFSSLAISQTFRGAINGAVEDASGAVVPGVTIVAIDDPTGVGYHTVSSNAGEYALHDLPLGAYTVSFTQKGFQTLSVKGVPVTAGSVYTLTRKLTVAQQITNLQVDANALALDSTTYHETQLIPYKAVQQLPMNGRDFTQFASLTTGFAGYSAGGTASMNGTRDNQINWQIEGADNNDLWYNQAAINQAAVNGIAGTTLPLDAVEEFSMATESGAEVGRNPGGTVDLTIKSGTNQFHGSLYYFNRNEALAKPSPFLSGESPKLRNEQYGLSAGGPILKNKSFFFLALEKQNFIISVSQQGTEPSAAYQALALNELAEYGITPNPVSQRLLANLWPQSALTGPAASPNYSNPGYQTGFSYNGLIKFDHNLNENHHLSFKWYTGEGTQVAPNGSALTPYFEAATTHAQNYSLAYNAVLSPHMANQLFAGVLYYTEVFRDDNNSYQPVALGLNTGVTSPSLTGAPHIEISPSFGASSGFDDIGLKPASGRNDIIGHLDENLSYTFGKHQLLLGGEYRQAQVDDFYQDDQRGTLLFDGTQGPWTAGVTPGQPLQPCQQLATQNLGVLDTTTTDTNIFSLADFLSGCIESGSIVQGNPKRQVFTNNFSLFVQDAWQISKKLNLNMGLRYDFMQPFHSQYQNLATFLPSAPNGLAVVGQDLGTIYPNFWKAVSPRVGFAYQVSPTMVARGGVGIFFDQTALAAFLRDDDTSNDGAVGLVDNPAGVDQVAQSSIGSTVIQDGVLLFPAANSAPSSSNIVNLYAVDQHFQPAYNTNFNLNVQKSFGSRTVWQIGYVGSVGRHLLGIRDMNQSALGSDFVDTVDGNGYTYQQTTRPYFNAFPNYGTINEIVSGQNSSYNSLQTQLRITGSHGLSSQFNYTWSHSLDNGTFDPPLTPQDSNNLAGDYGNSAYDTRHNFNAWLSYELPQLGKRLPFLSKGWEVNGVLTFYTGQPFTVFCGCDQSGTGEGADRAVQIANPFTGASHKLVDGVVQWVNPNAFTQAPQGSFGTMARNSLYAPGYGDVDLSVFKTTHLGDRFSAEFRVEMFNLFNRVNLAPPSNSLGSGFGQVTTTFGASFGAPGIGPGEPYSTQLALKILF
jgi:hypothetical protein